MYLSRLDVVGFKSFAQKTAFTFSEGLSALVGPNGCGKTNIVDAIRWVLGEKKASVLRSDVMENVIFNGTKNRKPLGMAEVILTIENNKNILPLEYNQITVSRRLYRSGESEYFLNKTKCRLRDIYDLFLDTGMGSDSYSVIELKMVEAILSGRVDERRSMFEEAAGIKKYKLRRKETGRKLDSVQQDLERVQDIVEEVRKNVNSLSRQAAKTRRYNKLTEELKELEIRLYKNEIDKIIKVKTTLDEELNVLNKEKIKFDFEITEEEKSISELKQKLHNVAKEQMEASDKEKALNQKLSYEKERLLAKKEKLTSFDTTKTILQNQIEDAENKIKDINNQLGLNTEQVEVLKSKLSEIENELKNVQIYRQEAAEQVNKLRESTGTANEEVLELQNRINSLKSLINRNNLKKDSIETKIQKNDDEKISLNQQLEELDNDIDSAKSKNAELEIDLQHAEDEFNTQQERKQSLQNNHDNLRDELSDKKNQLSSKKASLDFLEGLSDTNESSKFLMKEENWSLPFEKIMLGEAVGVDEELRIAVEAALGDYAHSFIVNNSNEADTAISRLKEKVKGKASFIIKDNVPEIESYKDIKKDGVYGLLSEIVRTDDQLRNALRHIVGKTAIVKDADSAYDVINSDLSDRAVTLEGEIIERSGFKKGGSISKKEGQTIGKKERIDKLKSEIDSIKKEIENINNEIDSLKDEIQSIDINELKNNVKNIENELNRTIHQVNQLELKGTAIDDKLKLIDSSSKNHNDELAEIDQENSKFTDELDELQDKINNSRESFQSIQNELSKAEEALAEKELEVKNKDMDRINIEAEKRNLERENKNLENEINNLEIKLKAKNEELENGEEDKEILVEEIEELKKVIDEISNRKDEANTKAEILNQEKDSLQEQYEQYADQINSKRREYDKVKEKIHEKDIKLSEINLRIENISNKIQEDYQINIYEVETVEIEGFSADESKAEISQIKTKLANIGNVNFLALEEYEQQSARLEFYDKQMADLTESEKILKETMDEINTAAEKNFRETFIKIRDNFKKLFQSLFGPEGEADIKLATEDNPLESDIEIIAKPPYKKPHSIEMLSGGEKTLTAIALLFGIYLVKPSPFCILDEVDAPLDDNNIGKFINLIKDFSIDTQFLIVTHNKGTMEAADTLYGVTMQEDGVSKVVSVKVDGEKKNADAA